MADKSTIIFYFSGTGNSYHAAQSLSCLLKDAQFVRIVFGLETYNLASYERIIAVYPCYVGDLPLMVKDYLEHLDFPDGAQVVSVCCCGGIDGSCHKSFERIIDKKGSSLYSSYTLVYPANNQLLYPEPSEKTIDTRYATNAQKLQEIASNLKDGYQHFADYKVLSASIFSLAHKFFDPHKQGRRFKVSDACNSCKICELICPAKNIRLIKGIPQFLDRCEQCLSCMHRCLKDAIYLNLQSRIWGRYKNPYVSTKDLMVN